MVGRSVALGRRESTRTNIETILCIGRRNNNNSNNNSIIIRRDEREKKKKKKKKQQGDNKISLFSFLFSVLTGGNDDDNDRSVE